MVGIKKLFILLSISALPLSVAAQSGDDGFINRQLSQLALRNNRLSEALCDAQQKYEQQPCDSLAQVIFELDRQISAIEGAIERLIEQQIMEDNTETSPTLDEPQVAASEHPQAAESEHPHEAAEVVPTPTEDSAMPESIDAEVVTELPSSEEEVSPQEPSAEQSDNSKQQNENKTIISDELKLLFNTTSRRYALIENEINALIDEYTSAYTDILASLDGYDAATSLATLNKHYADYQNAVERSNKIADTIADRSDLLFTSKTNSYLLFADTLGLSELRANHLTRTENTERTMTEKLAGRCSDLDVAMYPHRLCNTLLLEAELAHHITPEKADSLTQVAENYDTTHTLFAPWGSPKRSSSKFEAVKIQKNAKERAVSSLPTIKIPSEGELYSIMVANYASLPPSTKAFRGATPLFLERREDGRTYVYIGLYPTALSAQDDIALLRQVGFKAPTLVMWRDGIRRDDFVDRSAAASSPKTAMWRVEIDGSEGTLPSELVTLIREKAPRKEISKYNAEDGRTIYTVGIFTKESEAKALAGTLSQTAPTLSIKVAPLKIKN